jgi:hypothetical protein
MFGFGNRRRVRHNAFGAGRLRGAALAGLGMLAWKWWRNRQAGAANRTTSYQDRSFTERSSHPADEV